MNSTDNDAGFEQQASGYGTGTLSLSPSIRGPGELFGQRLDCDFTSSDGILEEQRRRVGLHASPWTISL